MRAKGLHIRDGVYGPTIYNGRRKVEGPFESRIGPHGAEGRLEVLKERTEAELSASRAEGERILAEADARLHRWSERF